jgi:hypothetical protein
MARTSTKKNTKHKGRVKCFRSIIFHQFHMYAKVKWQINFTAIFHSFIFRYQYVMYYHTVYRNVHIEFTIEDNFTVKANCRIQQSKWIYIQIYNIQTYIYIYIYEKDKNASITALDKRLSS